MLVCTFYLGTKETSFSWVNIHGKDDMKDDKKGLPHDTAAVERDDSTWGPHGWESMVLSTEPRPSFHIEGES